MDIQQLKTFVTVAREGSITRASERLYLSQPAVSAHVKAIEDTLGVTLFLRAARGMNLTSNGQRLLLKAEAALEAHRELFDEATRINGRLTGNFRLGAGGNFSSDDVGRLLGQISERCPDVKVALQHTTSADILNGIRNGSLDGGFYNEAGEPAADLVTVEVSHFSIYLAAAPELFPLSQPVDWQALRELLWIYPTSSTCCEQAAENLFRRYNFRPKRIMSVDRANVTRTLLAAGKGVGLLHADAASVAEKCGEVNIICEVQNSVRVLFAYLAERANDPLLAAVSSILRREDRCVAI